ncbi:hypothetical protein [uncultured Cohaesibacter sp.]|nr:hypothetical protein [uncultured Cohaesibacter sp.]
MILWQVLKEDYPAIMGTIVSLVWLVFACIGFFTVVNFVFGLGWV